MNQYVLRRLALFAPTLLLASFLVFGALRILPGDVALLVVGADTGFAATEEQLESIRTALGLNDPLPVQYLKWIRGLATFDLGKSFVTGQTVVSLLVERIPVTVQLALYTLTISVFVSVPLGIFSALFQNRWPDYTIRIFTILGLAIPSFWLGLVVIRLLVSTFAWLPPTIYYPIWEDPGQNFLMMIVPATILAWSQSSFLVRMMRATLLEVIRQDYVRTARSKGLAPSLVIRRHAIRNALLPVVTLMGASLGSLIAGVVIIEAVFNISGMGQALVSAVQQRDYPVIQAVAMFLITFTLTANLLVDLSYMLIDPRIRY